LTFYLNIGTVLRAAMAKRKVDTSQLTLAPAPRSAPPALSEERTPLRVAGLFAGIGGFELGLARAGHHTSLLCEIEPGAREVLAHHFPDTYVHDDVCSLNSLPRSVDLLVGGFPCQDLSQAGKTVGIEGSRSGLVGEVFRLLRAQPVRWVVLENVPFMLQLSQGRAMEVIVTAIEALGYKWAYRVVDSRAFGVPQRRERVVLVASQHDDPRTVLFADEAEEEVLPADAVGQSACGFYWTEGVRGLGWAVNAVPTLKGGSGLGIPSPPAIVLRDGRVVTPDIRDAERMQGFEAGWTEPTTRVTRAGHRWKLVGNAVTVDMAAWLGRRLRQPAASVPDVPGLALVRAGAWPKAAWNVGDGRYAASISSYPIYTLRPALEDWLQFPTAGLSEKATRGFLSRTESASLRFPPRFIEAVRQHLRSVEGSGATARAV
jgi:DNA (cytosine-5)-methyltransferase 1